MQIYANIYNYTLVFIHAYKSLENVLRDYRNFIYVYSESKH